MTAFAVKLQDATFTSARKGMRLPNRRKLVGEYVLGVSQAETIKNRADPSKPMTVQGVPTYNTTNAVVRSSLAAGYGFKTGIITNDDATIIVVRENPALLTQPFIVGFGNAGGTAVGFRYFAAPNDNWFYNAEGVANQGAHRTVPGAGVYFEAGVMSRQNPQRATGGFGKLYYYSGGVQQVATSANQSTNGAFARYPLLGGQAFTEVCIGSNSLSDSIDTNTIPIYFVAIYQRTLTSAEIHEAYTSLVAYYATRGVTVT